VAGKKIDNVPRMKSLITAVGLFPFLAVTLLVCVAQAPATQARRLILKDGTYQSVTKYEVHEDRVRYFSAERGEWEEVPKNLIDWDATDKFEKGRQANQLAPEAVELDKELEAERKAEQVRSPEVAPGLRLPDEGGVFVFDTFESQPQLAELQQSGGDLDKNTKYNVLRAVMNPLAGVKQNIQLPGLHSKVQSHTTVPSLYMNLDSNNGSESIPNTGSPTASTATGETAPLPASERFKIIRVEAKGGKRVAGAVRVAVNGKVKTDERFVATTVTAMTGGWVKLTPTEPLATGEYAVAEMLGKDAINLYVWDFGVNPSAPANTFTWKPDPTEAHPKPDQPAELQKREKQ